MNIIHLSKICIVLKYNFYFYIKLNLLLNKNKHIRIFLNPNHQILFSRIPFISSLLFIHSNEQNQIQ